MTLAMDLAHADGGPARACAARACPSQAAEPTETPASVSGSADRDVVASAASEPPSSAELAVDPNPDGETATCATTASDGEVASTGTSRPKVAPLGPRPYDAILRGAAIAGPDLAWRAEWAEMGVYSGAPEEAVTVLWSGAAVGVVRFVGCERAGAA